MKRAILKIFGRVQGVLFRSDTLKKAQQLDLTGWVKNELDDTVSITAEGNEENLKKLIDWCQTGSLFAKVVKVEVKWDKASGEFNDFSIKYS